MQKYYCVYRECQGLPGSELQAVFTIEADALDYAKRQRVPCYVKKTEARGLIFLEDQQGGEIPKPTNIE